MVTTGQVNTNTTYDSFFWVFWSQYSQDIANNSTKIYWSCGVTCGHSFYSNAIKMSAVTINGVQVYGGGTYSNFAKGENRIAYGYLDIPHNADGTKTFSIGRFTGWLYSGYDYSSDGNSFELTSIPRKATLLSATDFTDLENPSITYSNPAGESASTLQAYIYDTDDVTILVDGRDLEKNGSSYTLRLTDAERDRLRSATPGKTKKVWFYIKTIIGGVKYWSNMIEKTFSIVESDATRPKVNSMVVLPYNNGLPSKFNGLYIQGKSRVDIEIYGEGKYGADISCYATMEGKTYNSAEFTSDVIQGSGTVAITGYVKDSRGFIGSAPTSITVIDYAKPAVVPISSENAILCYRSDGNGKRVGASTSVWIKAKRSYYSVSGKNTCSLQWRWKPASAQWNDASHPWKNLRSGTDAADEYNAMVEGTFDKKESYTIQIRVKDDIGEQDIKTFDVPTEDVAIHLGKGGKNVTVGSYCDYSEDYTFRSVWKAIFDKEVVIGGQQLVNFVVEEGTDGIWKYRKWADGTAECWGIHVQENVPIDIAWGVLYESPGYAVDLPSGLFVETPQFNITLEGSSGAMLEVYSLGSAAQSPHLCAVRPFAMESKILNTSIVCHGRWR